MIKKNISVWCDRCHVEIETKIVRGSDDPGWSTAIGSSNIFRVGSCAFGEYHGHLCDVCVSQLNTEFGLIFDWIRK
jgi:hypothetical protein